MKTMIRFIVSRMIKLLGNISKVLCYLFHFIAPHKRFLLPEYAPPLWNRTSKDTIPKKLWQTNYTNKVTLSVYLNYLFNRIFSPYHSYHFSSTEQRDQFIRNYYPESIYNSYSQLQIGAAQADLWRLLVLQKWGGVYMDIDAHLVWPLHWIIQPEYSELYLKIKDGRLTNYFIASKPNNPNLQEIIDKIIIHIEQNKLTNVYELTGPAVFDSILSHKNVLTAYYRYTCNQGNFTNEFFQYMDKPQGKWNREQEQRSIIRPLKSTK